MASEMRLSILLRGDQRVGDLSPLALFVMAAAAEGRKLFFAKSLSKIACQAPKRPNSMTHKEIELA
jgi:hypothetical protein